MNTLVIAEHDNRSLKGSTLNTLGAAAQLGGEVHLLVAGLDCGGAVAEAAALPGVSKVLVADADAYQHQLAESLSRLVADLGKNYTHILAPAGSAGKNLMPRVAALLDVAQLSDIVGVVSPSTFRRPIYAGNAIATVQSLDPVVVATVRVSAFDPQPAQGGDATIQTLDVVHETGTVRFVGEELAVSDRPDLGSARIVVSGGRGLGSGENFALIESLADKLGAAVGASRAAVDAGFVANDRQVGQTGKIVAPELYVAVGISGAIQHLAGMKDSKVIVAINKDEEAPIFQVADYGLVADLFEAVPELERAL
ncbi:electron transfer flavoprotein subunit alpha/FixB family protein [Azotobacter bryophylli]|uniref:Electron transfer flavoprotein subunit alpha/FixB family protein n=1 Tax=Azotobacter bryophylli TaxID=1986537 RepID=A0ABV7AW81_9GAMM